MNTNQALITTLSKQIQEWAKSAGSLAKELRNPEHTLDISLKYGRDWVTNADLAVDNFLREKINTHYPTHQILSEELAPNESTNLPGSLWIIDPIDGTHNYALGLYYSAISIAYAEHGQVLLGAVYDFFHDELFFAEKNKGATLNSRPIKPSAVSSFAKSHILLGQHWPQDSMDEYIRQVNNVISKCRDFRRPGAGALDICMVAAGRAEAFFETLMPWDIAAARLIAMESGCSLGHFGADPAYANIPEDLNARYFLVANPSIYQEIFTLISVS